MESKVVRIQPEHLRQLWHYKVDKKLPTLSEAIAHALEKAKEEQT